MKVADLYWVEFPTGAGRAQAGRRPAVVIQATAATQRLPTVLMMPLTTQLDALRFPGTVLLEPDGHNHLRRPSVVLVFQLAAVDKRFISTPLGHVSQVAMREIRSALDDLLGRRGTSTS